MVQITVSQAQTTVPNLTISDIAEEFKIDIFSEELHMLYISNLLMRGKLNEAKEYIGTLPVDSVRIIVNITNYHTYYGSVLHVLLYWNNNKEAFDLYKLLTSVGAKPIRDYYGMFPWEQNGILYVAEENHTDNERIQEEFTWLYNEIKNLENVISI